MSGPPVIPASALLPALQRTEALLSSLRALVLSTTSPTGLAEGNLKPGAQTALLRAARGIVRALELTPYDVVFGYSELAHAYGAAATLIDLGVLDKIPGIADDEAPNGKGVCVGAAAPNGAAVKKKDGKTIDELAAEINEGKEGKIGEVDPTLLARTVRMCVADEILEEISDPAPASGQASPSEALAAARRHPRYRHNFRSRFLVSPSVHPRGMGGALVMSLDFSIPALRMHEYVRTHTVEQFRDHRRSPYSWAAGQEGKTIYEILDSGDPQRRARFFGTMRASEKAQPVKGMFPFASVVTPEAYDRSRALVVDVGGGHGRALVAIRAELRAAGWGHDAPSQPRMVLEELPAVVKKVAELADPELGDVETVAYDMFTPQIVKSMYTSVRQVTRDQTLRGGFGAQNPGPRFARRPLHKITMLPPVPSC